MSDLERAKWPRQIIGAAVMGIFFVGMRIFGVGLIYIGSHSMGADLLWGFVPVVGVLFGFWGLLAVYVGSMLNHWFLSGNPPSLYSSVFFASFGLSIMAAALIPAWVFRQLKGDARIRTSRDGVLFMLFGSILIHVSSPSTS